jgi:hypothetical protein
MSNVLHTCYGSYMSKVFQQLSNFSCARNLNLFEICIFNLNFFTRINVSLILESFNINLSKSAVLHRVPVINSRTLLTCD